MNLLDRAPKSGFEFLKRIEAAYPPNVDVTYNMGIALLYLGRLEEAEKYFNKTLKIDLSHEAARTNLDLLVRIKEISNKGCTRMHLEELGEIATDAREAGLFVIAEKIGNIMIEVDKGPGALNDLGLTFQHQNQIGKALECYDRALKIDPNSHEVLSNKAFCLMMTDRLNEAYTIYESLIKLSPDFLQGWYHMGLINVKKEDYQNALNYLNKAIELNDEYYLAWITKYQALIKLKRTEEAQRCWENAVDLNPEYAMHLALGEGAKIQTTTMHAKHNNNA